MHANSELLFKTYAIKFIRPESRALEIGPDTFPSTYQKIMPHATQAWHTVDIYDSKKISLTLKLVSIHFPSLMTRTM